jgi:hypothetical protein
MKHEIYNNCKSLLIGQANEAKRTVNGKDKPYIRQCINDAADNSYRSIEWHCMKSKYSEAMAKQYIKWLESLACSLHPKK